LLDPQGASLFRRIGHFAGEATLERIEHVCGEGIDDVLESLAQLVDLSLVRRTRDGRFEVASALRTYSRELLDESGERDALCRRHAETLIAEWLPLAIERPMTAYREAYGPVLAEQSDLVVLLAWSARADAELFSELIACTYPQLYQSLGSERMERWRQPIEQAADDRPRDGPGTDERTSRGGGCAPGPGRLDLALEADTEGDSIYAGWLYGTCAVMDAQRRPSPAWLDRAQAVAAELGASPDPDVRDLATILNAHLLLGQERFDEAADAFEASIRRGGGTWAAETTVYMEGDCHLLAGRAREALPAYARGVAYALERGAQVNIGFQGEGIAAALADLGRHEDALETLGACDARAGDGAHPRELNAAWNSDVMAPRIASARATLGAQVADAAYARGRVLGIDQVVELLLSYATLRGG
jgi:tetratricopeptide (TPR) repeat protein